MVPIPAEECDLLTDKRKAKLAGLFYVGRGLLTSGTEHRKTGGGKK